VVLWHPTSTFEHTTNQRRVSIARPGPTMEFHQPGWRCPGPALPLTWESPVSAWAMNRALEPFGFSRPQLW